MAKQLRHDRHTVSLLTDHMVFSPKYRGKVLAGEVAMVAEAIIRKTCKELDIEVIDMSVSPDHIHLFIQYPPKYSVSFIAKRLKGRSSRILRQEFPELKEWCKSSLWAPSCYHGSVGHGWEEPRLHRGCWRTKYAALLRNILPDKIRNRKAEIYYTGLGLKSEV